MFLFIAIDHLWCSLTLNHNIIVVHILLNYESAHSFFQNFLFKLLLTNALELSLDILDVFLVFGTVHGQLIGGKLSHPLDLRNDLDLTLRDGLVLE